MILSLHDSGTFAGPDNVGIRLIPLPIQVLAFPEPHSRDTLVAHTMNLHTTLSPGEPLIKVSKVKYTAHQAPWTPKS
jgi:hypothetical protein